MRNTIVLAWRSAHYRPSCVVQPYKQPNCRFSAWTLLRGLPEVNRGGALARKLHLFACGGHISLEKTSDVTGDPQVEIEVKPKVRVEASRLTISLGIEKQPIPEVLRWTYQVRRDSPEGCGTDTDTE